MSRIMRDDQVSTNLLNALEQCGNNGSFLKIKNKSTKPIIFSYTKKKVKGSLSIR